MNKKIPLTSTTFGVGNEHLALSAAEGDGILIAGNYSPETRYAGQQELPGGVGEALRRRQGGARDLRFRSTRASCCGPRRCGRPARSSARRLIKTLETGLKIEGPAGTVAVDPQDTPCVARHPADGGQGPEAHDHQTSKQRPPGDTAAYCDLLEEPERQQAVRGQDLKAATTDSAWTTQPSSSSRSCT